MSTSKLVWSVCALVYRRRKYDAGAVESTEKEKDMKARSLFLILGLLAGCSSRTGEAPRQDASDTPTPSGMSDMPAVVSAPSAASAMGIIKAVDPAAKTVTIAHDPVAALQWPAMTMTFQAPDADLSSLKQGDRVSFEFTASGMDGTITAIRRE